MHGKVHKDMVLRIIKNFRYRDMVDWIFYHCDSSTDLIKHYLDLLDDKYHHSKTINEHAYKIDDKGILHKPKPYHSDAIALLERDTKDVRDWVVEKRHKIAVAEMLKALHLVVDLSTPPHIMAGWSSKVHSAYEAYCNRHWDEYYEEDSPAKIREKSIGLWALKKVKKNYIRNEQIMLLAMSRQYDIEQVIVNCCRNVNDYLYYHYRWLYKKGVFSW